ncbi:hypothetical protein [Bacillus sp. Marseille-P3661]|nr:hypothetical protein [Bacillus sp. Marseille-P3661]
MEYLQYLLPTTWTGVTFFVSYLALAVFINIKLNNAMKKEQTAE